MSEDQLRNEFQTVSADLQKFDEYGKQLQGQIESLQNYLIDLTRSKATLSGLKDEQDTEETLFQLGSGIMIKAKPIESDTVLANVGAGVIVSKPLDEAIKGIESRIEEVNKERAMLADQLGQITNQINMLERKAQSIYQKIQGTPKAQYDPSLVS